MSTPWTPGAPGAPRDPGTASAPRDPVVVPDRPRIPGNDHGVLSPPEVGAWEPHLTVSVVIPARGRQDRLDLTLAALAAQTYPSHLLEVIVVDDGSAPPLRLPEITPERTRIVGTEPGRRGIAWALETGTAAADGQVIHRLDADIVAYREHVETHLRWHHLADYLVVTGTLRFTAAEGTPPTPAEVRIAVSKDRADTLFEEDPDHGHGWIDELVATHRGFRDAPAALLHRVHVGATVSLPAALLREAGGLDTSLVLGEDTELGYRLTQAGAVFVPETGALSWHLGTTTAMRRPAEVRRHNEPFIADRIPYRRTLRTDSGRQWLVPYVDVVVDAGGGARFEDVRASVDGSLASTLPDVRVTVTGPWESLEGERPAPLDDPLLDLRLLHGQYAHDGRVSFAGQVPATSAPAPFRFVCPAGWVPGAESLDMLTERAEKGGEGLLLVALDEDETGVLAARLERTAAVARALRVAREGEPLDDVIAELYGVTWLDAESWRLLPAARAYPSWARNRNREAARWRAAAEAGEREAERARGRIATLRAEVKELRAAAAKGRRDAARWREKAERHRLEAVALRRARQRSLLARAARRLRGLAGGSD
ncbi:glycosyltransferase [Streptosporangium sp. NPDC023615]|uniref:glycosyltransferase n=1 Tax=Streptosporangium sp. NPDC023615 TaxID=3154794 RepID=UPI003427D549